MSLNSEVMLARSFLASSDGLSVGLSTNCPGREYDSINTESIKNYYMYIHLFEWNVTINTEYIKI